MHTDPQSSDRSSPPTGDAEERRRRARLHAALFPTRLALERWQHGSPLLRLQRGSPLALRSDWHAAAQRNFQAWLDRGGFSQYDEAPQSPCPQPPVAYRPAGEGDAQQIGTCT
ncbi:hypothetical protein LE190_01500 [Massilia oculi]|uniref:Uncharacterized protein n=1 Tax=Massilia hydrophila TaxID=3044279 RepID=A0ABS7Y6I7_9BURK|nr:hypothetical protein [Massilia oculi]MCA1854602.1 hypothetical protein [Massilia oculi]